MFIFRSRRTALVRKIWAECLHHDSDSRAGSTQHQVATSPEDQLATADLRSQLSAVLKRLREPVLEQLLEVLERRGQYLGPCCSIPNSRLGRHNVAPLVLMCKLWRWKDLTDSSELVRLPICKHDLYGQNECCNPYHWARLAKPEDFLGSSPARNVLSPFNCDNNTDTVPYNGCEAFLPTSGRPPDYSEEPPGYERLPGYTEGVPPGSGRLPGYTVNFNPKADHLKGACRFVTTEGYNSVNKGFNDDFLSAGGRRNDPGGCRNDPEGCSNDPNGCDDNVPCNLSTAKSCDKSDTLLPQGERKGCFNPFRVVQGAISDAINGAISDANDNHENNVRGNLPIHDCGVGCSNTATDHCTGESSAGDSQAFLPGLPVRPGGGVPGFQGGPSVGGQSVATGGSRDAYYSGPPHWCTLAYWEERTRVGRQFHVSADSVQVFSELPRLEPDAEALCLHTISARDNPSAPQSIVKARQKIGLGVILSISGSTVSVYNRSDIPLFVNSPTLDLPNSRTFSVYKILPGYSMQVFDFNTSRNLEKLNNARRLSASSTDPSASAWLQPDGPYDPHAVRLSFGKGWGGKYSRQIVTSCPCWLEILLVPPR